MASPLIGGFSDAPEARGRSPFDPTASAGLFVGISIFERDRFAQVPFAVDDAVDLAYLFVAELGLLLPERTMLLLAGEPRKAQTSQRLAELLKRGAQRNSARMPDVYGFLGEMTRATQENGLFIFTVATHGLSHQGGDFLVATDSRMEKILLTGIAVGVMFDEIGRAAAARRLILLDACRERLSIERGVEGPAMTKSFAEAISRARGSVVLSGATLGGYAYDDSSRENGVFTAAVLDGLHGGAQAGPEGWITVDTLADFVQERVADWVRSHRPDHVDRSLGIERRVEATAEDLPLAPHATRALQLYQARRDKALVRARENQGRVLSGAHWDQIVALLPADRIAPVAEPLLSEIEALDGTERSQRSLRDLLRDLAGSGDHPPRLGPGWDRWRIGLLVGLLLVAVCVSYLLYLQLKEPPGPRLDTQRELSPTEQSELERIRRDDPARFREKQLWPVRSSLRVRFLDGDDQRREKFKKAFAEWLRYAHLRVSYAQTGDAEVRVSFSQPGSWAFRGTDALALIEGDGPTINLGFEDGSDLEVPRNYLHEIGHVLGLVHETKNPQAELKWDRAAVYAALSGPPMSWTRAQVDANLFDPEPYPGSRPFDSKSIMLMALPAEYFTDRKGFPLPDALSESDKRYIASLYP